MDNTFIKNYTMMKAHELGYNVYFNRNGSFNGFNGFAAVVYTRFLEDMAGGMDMPDYYNYLFKVDKNKFYDYIYKNIESWENK